MPIYAYRCATCGHAQDVLQKMSDDLLTVCPSCHAATYTKQVTAAGFQLKGSGWYVTDFRGGNTGKPETKPETQPGATAGDSAAPATPAAAAAADSKPADGKAAASPAPAAAAAPKPAGPTPSAPSPSSSS